jgi:fructose-1,6-bisphosphatase class II
VNRNLALEFVRVTEMASIASARLMGRGDEKAADQAAVDAMRSMLDSVECDATIVIGEGERDEAPMLFIGGYNSISVMAIGEKGCLMNAPDTYMNKIAVGPEAKGVIDITLSPTENIKRVAEAKKCRVQDLTAMVLERPRHADLIQELRETGCRIHLIGDGDVSAAIATALPDSGIDILFGIGGAPEGVISAAALRCMGGDFQGVFVPRNEEEIARARQMGIEDINKVMGIEDLAKGNVMFVATGVTDGSLLDGVKFKPWGAVTHSIVMRSESGTIRHIEAEHHFDKKPRY